MIRTLADITYNALDCRMLLPKGTYHVHAVEPDGTIVLQDFGVDVHVALHPSEFVWLYGQRELFPEADG